MSGNAHIISDNNNANNMILTRMDGISFMECNSNNANIGKLITISHTNIMTMIKC